MDFQNLIAAAKLMGFTKITGDGALKNASELDLSVGKWEIVAKQNMEQK